MIEMIKMKEKFESEVGPKGFSFRPTENIRNYLNLYHNEDCIKITEQMLENKNAEILSKTRELLGMKN
jgi:hypothetical protein